MSDGIKEGAILIKMAEIELTRISSKGQIVIPRKMRKDFHKGEDLILIKAGKQIIMKKASDLDKKLKEDIEFARRTEEALKRIEKGNGIRMDFDEFIKKRQK